MLSWAGLALTILPALLVFNGLLSLEQHKGWMLLGTGLWFGGEVYRRIRR